MLQFHLWTKTPSNTEQGRREEVRGEEGGERQREGEKKGWREREIRIRRILREKMRQGREGEVGCAGDKMAGQQEQVDKDMIMINQQHVYTKLALSPSLSPALALCASSLFCGRPLIYDMIASAMCLRGTHKSISSLLNTRARQGYRFLHTAKKCPPQQVISYGIKSSRSYFSQN